MRLAQVEQLLDVAFGVVVGVALTELPDRVGEFVDARGGSRPDLATAALPLALLASGLIFSVFYWLETRFFISAQERFDRAILRRSESDPDGVGPRLGIFLLGSLVMMALAAGVLGFASMNRFRLFLLASLVFWIFDLLGTVVLKREYGRHKQAIEAQALQHPEEWRWFRAHIGSGFFYAYGAVNVAFFTVLLVADVVGRRAVSYRLVAALVVLAVTLFRHLAWRSVILNRWGRRNELRSAAS